MKTKKYDCETCKFNNGIDCTNKGWIKAVNRNEKVENKDGCLFWAKQKKED